MQSAELGISKHLNTGVCADESATEDENWESQLGHRIGCPGRVDADSVELQVGEDALSGSESGEPHSPGSTICLPFLAFSNWTNGHCFFFIFINKL